ncbi:MAG: cytochrome c oxidase subunit 3 [Glaciecola sp.]|jgi:cytochrome c oxidase subunit 3
MSNLSPEEKLEIRTKTHRQLMWVGVFSITMMFGGLSSAYIVSKADVTWVKIFPPVAFYISSVAIILSSIFYFFALQFIKKGKKTLSTIMVAVTLILGFVFLQYQVKGWSYLNERGSYVGGNNNIRLIVENDLSEYGKDYIVVQNGIELAYFEGDFYDTRDKTYSSPVKKVNLNTSNNSSSYFFLLTGLHFLHLIGGLISLIIVLVKSVKGRYSKDDMIGIKVSAIYWHFLGFLWLYLLGLLYYIG